MVENNATKQEEVIEEYDLRSVDKKVRVDGRLYLLREASADAARQFNNKHSAAIRYSAGGKDARFEGIADADYLLVSLCMGGEAADGRFLDERGHFLQPLHLQTVLAWPNRVVDPLARWVKRVSDLTKEVEDPDPELVAMCRRELALDHHPERGGRPGVMDGVNAACDWITERHKERGDLRKNGQPFGTDSSEQPKSLGAPSESTSAG